MRELSPGRISRPNSPRQFTNTANKQEKNKQLCACTQYSTVCSVQWYSTPLTSTYKISVKYTCPCYGGRFLKLNRSQVWNRVCHVSQNVILKGGTDFSSIRRAIQYLLILVGSEYTCSFLDLPTSPLQYRLQIILAGQ
jgi:hypothetical protein